MSEVNSKATSVNKLIEALLSTNFTGDVLVTLKKNQLKLAAGTSNITASTDGVIYWVAEQDPGVLKDGSYTFKMEDGVLTQITQLAEKPAAAKPERKVSGGHSSAKQASRLS